MDYVNESEDWSKLAPEEKKRRLFLKQKALLDTFREHNAISQDQYDKSLNDLREKMGGMEDYNELDKGTSYSQDKGD